MPCPDPDEKPKIEPRRRLLADGRLVEFAEWETSERTEIAGDIAGGGRKTFQYVSTPEGLADCGIGLYDQP
jgi:hypothetical protein